MGKADNPVMRELFIEELVEVTGGGPIEDAMREYLGVEPGGGELGGIPGWETTMACCEEGNSCCP